MTEKKKATAAHMRATKKFEETAYFKTLVRFPAVLKDRIKKASGDSLNGFIVKTVMEKLAEIEDKNYDVFKIEIDAEIEAEKKARKANQEKAEGDISAENGDSVQQ